MAHIRIGRRVDKLVNKMRYTVFSSRPSGTASKKRPMFPQKQPLYQTHCYCFFLETEAEPTALESEATSIRPSHIGQSEIFAENHPHLGQAEGENPPVWPDCVCEEGQNGRGDGQNKN